MNKFLKKLLSPKIIIPQPEKYPHGDISQWLDQKVAYFEHTYPEEMQKLFNPSCADYLPKLIAVGQSRKAFKENIKQYREIKKRYPQAVVLAKKSYNTYSYYPEGDPQDY